MARDVDISKYMSLVLRHAPHEAGLTLDENGWADFDTLCLALGKKFGASRADIQRVVAENPKQRFTLSGNRIRAAQGHSVDVDLALSPSVPPAMLYHGTKTAFLGSIMEQGLTPRSRRHVHLSKDIATAKIVAARRKGVDAILLVDAEAMAKAGIAFFLSENDVWLTDHVAPNYLKPLTLEEMS